MNFCNILAAYEVSGSEHLELQLFWRILDVGHCEFTQTGCINNRNVLSSSSGGQKSEIQVSGGLVPSGVCEEHLSRPLTASGGLLAILAVLRWLKHCSDFHSYLLMVSSFECVFFCIRVFPLHKDTSHTGLEPTLMTSSWFNLQSPCFLISTFWGVLGVRTST